jgi:uncharacterized repeat protein (TIGR03803 family)
MKARLKSLTAVLAATLPWLVTPLSAQTAALSVVAPFAPFTDGGDPQSALVQGSDDNFYGVTYEGGQTTGRGEVFKITPAGVITSLHSFSGPDGLDPICALVEDSNGIFYGTTSDGGANGSGTIFSITSDGLTFTTLYSFSALTPSGNQYVNSDGSDPNAGLVAGPGNIFYGTTAAGGPNGAGTVFSITPAGVFTVLHNFTGTDGSFANSTLVSGSGGYYGTTGGGGLYENGTVFMVTTSGQFTSLYSFTAINDAQVNADGSGPISVIPAGNGLFYGTTLLGGPGGGGTIFSITSAGSFATLHSFTGTDGRNPNGLAVYGTTGYYGTTQGGGTGSEGTVFRINAAGSFLSIYSFPSTGGSYAVSPSFPQSGLIEGSNGYLYGTTTGGGAANGGARGTVFRITTGGSLTVLHNFGRSNSTGAYPSSGLVLGKNGLLYGTTTFGGINSTGTFYSVSTSGTIDALYGVYGSAFGLIQINDTNLYGVTDGGTYGDGSVVILPTTGKLITLHNFDGKDGTDPYSRLFQGAGANGDLYGTTSSGTLFQLTLNGALTTLYQFSGTGSGEYPNSILIGKDGNFYGTTQAGGQAGNGTIFQLTSTGVFTNLHSFSAVESYDYPLNTDGESPVGLIQATDGNFYGVAEGAGQDGDGELFKITSTGTFTPLHAFSPSNGGGTTPVSNPIQGTDGNLYVTTSYGGSSSDGYVGAVMQVTTAGVATTLYSFTGGNDGQSPEGSLVEGAIPGTFYGTANRGGENGTGTIFALTVSPAITSATTGTATVQKAFTYKVTATNTPTAFATSGLPAGLVINGKTGAISGTPTASGTFSVNLTAMNAGGSGKAVLKLTVAK